MFLPPSKWSDIYKFFSIVFSTQNIFASRTLLDEVVSFEIINETFTVEVNVLRQ